MKITLISFLLSLIFISVSAQNNNKENRLFVNFGIGPSYSIFYRTGNTSRDVGVPNIPYNKDSKAVIAFSHFAEIEWRLKDPKWSLRLGYAEHNYYPIIKASGYTPSGTSYNFDTREYDKNTYLQVTLQYALLTGKNQLEAGVGIYNDFRRIQSFKYGFTPPGGTLPSGAITVEDEAGKSASQGGVPINVDYIHSLKGGVGIGCRLNFNYSQTMRAGENLAAYIFIKARLK